MSTQQNRPSDFLLEGEALLRLQKLAKSFGSQKEIAQLTGIKQSSLSQILSKGGDVTLSRIASICSAIGASLQFIMSGEPEQKSDEFAFLPFYKDVSLSAGDGSAVPDIEQETEILPFPAALLQKLTQSPENVTAITVRGDSMAPALRNGDFVLIDSSAAGHIDGIYALRINGELMVKRVQWQPHKAIIVSDNPQYQPFELAGVDVDVIGRVIFAGQMM